jgi:4-aminobutyrate aminotransferase-like enzyme
VLFRSEEIRKRHERSGLLKVVPIRPNNTADLERAFAKYQTGKSRIAGFFHEIVLMNYGGRLLTKAFLKNAYALCGRHDVPTCCDEIQSCLWRPGLFMFREYGLHPTFVAIGKGFPGGEYPASRILFNARMDSLPQFGALVTNGQEEIAALAYLVTMRWALENGEITEALGDDYEDSLREMAARHPRLISTIEGKGHMASIYFHEIDAAKRFVGALDRAGLDISVQSYKAACPPGALTKLPLIMDREAIDLVLGQMEAALRKLSIKHGANN